MDFNNLVGKLRDIEPGDISVSAAQQSKKPVTESKQAVAVAPMDELDQFAALAGVHKPSPAKTNSKEMIAESTEVVAEKAVSKAQQKLMGQAYAVKKGDMKASDASDEVKELAKDMSMSDLKDFASTKHKGKPEHVKNESVSSSFREKFQKLIDEKLAEAKAKPDFLDMDKDGDKKEPMKKAIADKKKKEVKEGDNIYHSCVKSFKHAKFGEGEVLHGEHTLAEDGTVSHYDAKFVREDGSQFIVRNIPVANMTETIVVEHSHAKKKKKVKEEEVVSEAKDCNCGPDCACKGNCGPDCNCGPNCGESVKESYDTLTFKKCIQLVRESGGQQQINAVDKNLWTWAKKVAANKFTESAKRDAFAGLTYERMGGRFELHDILSETKK